METETSKTQVAFGVVIAIVLAIFVVLVVVLFACRRIMKGSCSQSRQSSWRVFNQGDGYTNDTDADACNTCCGGLSLAETSDTADKATLPSNPNTRKHTPGLSRTQWAEIHRHIRPFAVYFPQFHAMQENDTLFYKGMTDMKNLTSYLSEGTNKGAGSTAANLDTPSLHELQLADLSEYDGTNASLLARQAALAAEWGFQGFCIYFYWFAVNTITHRHQIMEACINKFFDAAAVALPPGFKVFFDWANEDWTKNDAFGASVREGVAITNVYTQQSFRDFAALLLTYFQHDRYLKVGGKPVLFLHHPWFLSAADMTLLTETLELGCLAAGFPGIHLCVNQVATDATAAKAAATGVTPAKPAVGFKFRPDYKSGRFRDYEDVIADAVAQPDASNIGAVFFGFNNAARMFKPPKPSRVHAIVATREQQSRLLQAVISSYKPSSGKHGLQRLFLVNAWNEWGEDMAVEPGKRNGASFLQMLTDVYKQIFLK